jgi:hypothetical protein
MSDKTLKEKLDSLPVEKKSELRWVVQALMLSEKKYEVGERVGAIASIDKDKDKTICRFFGYGKYAGEEVPFEAGGWMAQNLVERNVKNPKIKLDSGEFIYGCECWWGSEETIKKKVEGCDEVEMIDPNTYRAEALANARKSE